MSESNENLIWWPNTMTDWPTGRQSQNNLNLNPARKLKSNTYKYQTHPPVVSRRVENHVRWIPASKELGATKLEGCGHKSTGTSTARRYYQAY
jgi:hypothetical protein